MPRRPAAVASPRPDDTAAIAERAYYKAERRGFVPGFELDDWLAAEREVAQLFAPPAPRAARKSSARSDGAPAERKTAAKKSAAKKLK